MTGISQRSQEKETAAIKNSSLTRITATSFKKIIFRLKKVEITSQIHLWISGINVPLSFNNFSLSILFSYPFHLAAGIIAYLDESGDDLKVRSTCIWDRNVIISAAYLLAGAFNCCWECYFFVYLLHQHVSSHLLHFPFFPLLDTSIKEAIPNRGHSLGRSV